MVDQVFNGEQTFIDQNGDPLSGGLVYMYVPNTGTFSTTWSNSAGTIVNTNPIVLDQAGRCKIWGVGEYRQVVTDQFGNVQWDQITSAGNQASMSGNVSGDLSVTGNGIINGNLTVGGGITVTGGETVTGAFTSQGLFTAENGANITGTTNLNTLNANVLDVTGPSTSTISGGLIINPAPSQSQALQLNGSLGISTPNGSSDILEGDKILVRSGNTPGIAFVNTADALTMGWYEGGHALVSAIMDGNGNPVQNMAFIVGTGENAASVITPGRMFQARSGDSPCFNAYNTSDGIAWNMQASSGTLQWGTADGNGFLTGLLMKLDTSGELTTLSNILPGATNTGVGTNTSPWTAMYSHNFVTVSTDHLSAELTNGQLEVVKGIPVKTEPHIGISADDAKAIAGAVYEGGNGTVYAVLTGVLWKALQELSEKFDAYVAAHP